MKYPDIVDYKSFLTEQSIPNNESDFDRLVRELQIATIQHFLSNLECLELEENPNRSRASKEYQRQGIELKLKLLSNKINELTRELKSKSNVLEEDLKKFEAPEPIVYKLEIDHVDTLDEKTEGPTFIGTLEDCIKTRDEYLTEQSNKLNLTLRESHSQGIGIVRIAESETATIESFINKAFVPRELTTKTSMWDPKPSTLIVETPLLTKLHKKEVKY